MIPPIFAWHRPGAPLAPTGHENRTKGDRKILVRRTASKPLSEPQKNAPGRRWPGQRTVSTEVN